MIATERHLLDRAAGRRHERTALAESGDVAMAIDDAGLSAEQGALVRQVCLSGSGVEVIEGVAGSGKTTALAAAAKAWTASGVTVRGCALAARAAAGSRPPPVSRRPRSMGCCGGWIVATSASGRVMWSSWTKRGWSVPARSIVCSTMSTERTPRSCSSVIRGSFLRSKQAARSPRSPTQSGG
jgi:hypothetical protein